MCIFCFGFPVEIWGTVSDWIMILVTAGTAYLLWRTLKSQQEVQSAQNRLLEIEQIKLIKEFKPVIDYKDFHDETRQRFLDKLTNGSDFLSVAAKNLDENIAINYDFITANNSQVEVVEKFFPQPSLIKGDEFAAIHFIIKNLNNENPITYIFHFLFTYNDLIGTKYQQRVYCTKDENGMISIKSHIPEIIKLN